MDQLLDTYANVEQPSAHHSKRTREIKSSENIYANVDEIHSLEPNGTGPALSGAEDVKKSSCRAAAVFLGLLCLLLLAGLITLFLLYTKENSDWKTGMVQLQTSYNNLTKERDQLQASYNNLTKEKDQLQTNYNNLAEERDQLRKSFEDMAREINDLRRELQRWLYFSGSFYYISSLEKSWQESRDDCLQRGGDLEFVRRFQRLMWIGLTDRETEGMWKWVDGTPLTTSYWATSEPNGVQSRDEDCAEIRMINLENSWNDVSCDFQRSWICEKTLA